MYIQVHRSVNIENKENTLKHIYIVRKHSCEVEQYDMRYLRKTSNWLNIQIQAESQDSMIKHIGR